MPEGAYVVLAVLGLAGGVEAGGKSIFKLGDQIDHSPTDVLLMYMCVFAVTITLEAVVDHLHESVTSESGQQIIHFVTEEVMILGGISALLIVFQNLGGAEAINLDLALFHYIHFMIFAMAIFFIGLVSSLFFSIEYSWKRFSKFESNVISIEKDGGMVEETKRRLLRSFIAGTSGGREMWAAICFFRNDLPLNFSNVTFTHYMKKKQRNLLLFFLDLTGPTWFALAFLVGIQAAVTYTTQLHTTNDLAIISGYVLVVGLGPVLLLIILTFKIRKEYRLFTFMVEDIRQEGKVSPTWPQAKHFWFGDPAYIEISIQILLLFQVFYLATVTVNFVYRLSVVDGGLLLLTVSYVPSILVFGVLLPLVMPHLTILGAVGEFLCLETIVGLSQAQKASGRDRRERGRDKKNVVPSDHIMDDICEAQEERIVHAAPEEKKTISASQLKVQIKDKQVLQQRQQRENDRAKMCHECSVKPGTTQCDICGLLCAHCDQEYHRLRLIKHHVRFVPLHVDKNDMFDTPPLGPEKKTKKKKGVRRKKPLGASEEASPTLSASSPLAGPDYGNPSLLSMETDLLPSSSFAASESFISEAAGSTVSNPLKKAPRKAGARKPRSNGKKSEPPSAGDASLNLENDSMSFI